MNLIPIRQVIIHEAITAEITLFKLKKKLIIKYIDRLNKDIKKRVETLEKYNNLEFRGQKKKSLKYKNIITYFYSLGIKRY